MQCGARGQEAEGGGRTQLRSLAVSFTTRSPLSAGCNLQMFNLIVSSITVWTGVTYDGVGVGRLISYKIQLKIELV